MKILIHTDSPLLYSGLARCGRELAKRFCEKKHQDTQTKQDVSTYDVSYAAWHYENTRYSLPYFLYQLNKTSPEESKQFRSILYDAKPDIILSIGDIWNFYPICSVINEYKEYNNNAKWILWLTIDGENMHSLWQPVLDQADDIVVFSKFGQTQLQKTYSIKSDVIYPGVDKNTFHPIKINIKQNTLPFNVVDTFLVLNVNQNTDRKNMPLTLEAFRDFAVGKDDVFLLLVTDTGDTLGYDLWNLLKNSI